MILFWAWIGWFPFQVYSTTFVGEVLKRYDTNNRNNDGDSDDKLGDIARVGSTALVLFSCVSLVASVALPWFVEAPPSDELHQRKPLLSDDNPITVLWEKFQPYRPDLAITWVGGHITFSMLMFMTLFASTVSFATFLVAASGMAWALMTWAPFSIVGEEIQKMSSEYGDQRYESVALDDQAPDNADVVDVIVSRVSISSSVPPFSADEIEAAAGQNHNSTSELSGV